MKIISPFKDYYDSARGFGIEPGLVYVRKTESFDSHDILEKMKLGKRVLSIFKDMPDPLPVQGEVKEYSSVLVGFCGKVYSILNLDGKIFPTASLFDILDTEPPATRGPLRQLQLCYDPEGAKARSRHKVWYNKTINFTRKNFAAWERAAEIDLTPLFIELNCPVFAIKKATRQAFIGQHTYPKTTKSFEKNPQLGKLGFAKVIDPFQAWQRISMYVGNQLAKQMDPDMHMTDELKRHYHGFDETSFKTMTPGKKAKRKANRKRKRHA